jgi:hypothetical protein
MTYVSGFIAALAPRYKKAPPPTAVLRRYEIPRSMSVAAIPTPKGTERRVKSEINEHSVKTKPPGSNGIKPIITGSDDAIKSEASSGR